MSARTNEATDRQIYQKKDLFLKQKKRDNNRAMKQERSVVIFCQENRTDHGIFGNEAPDKAVVIVKFIV